VGIQSFSNIYGIAQQGTISFAAYSNDMSLYAGSNVYVSASNNLTVNAKSNASLTTASGSVNVTSFVDIQAIAKTGIVSVSAASNDVVIYSGSNTLMSSSNELRIISTSNTYVTSTHANVIGYADSNIVMTASNGIQLTASNTIDAYTNDFYFNVRDDATISTMNHLNLNSSNILNISACNVFNIDAGAMNTNLKSDYAITARSNMSFFISSAPDHPDQAIFQVTGSNVCIRGDMLISGKINTENIYSTTVLQTNMSVTDKVLVLASAGYNVGDCNNPTQGVPAKTIDGTYTNSLSGIVVEGVPSPQIHPDATVYEKSFLWNYGTNGINKLGTAEGSNLESFWEIKGGSLRLTNSRYDAVSTKNLHTSFAFRVNNLDQMELVKIIENATGAPTYKRLAVFGASL
jgi:hypothetical protein